MPDEKPAYFRHGDTEIELPVVRGSENELGADISKLRAQTGMITLDYGYMNTGACESAITYIDGDAGILRYRGVPIEQLVERDHPSYLETSYLLIYGELPNRTQLDEFRFGIRRHTLLHEDVKSFFNGFPKDAHPMAILSSVVSTLSTFYQDSDDPHDPEQVQLCILRLIGQLPPDEQVRGLEERRVVPLHELLDRDPSVAEHARVAVDVGDRRLARPGVDEPVVERDHPGSGAQLADVDAKLVLAPADDRKVDLVAVVTEDRGGLTHGPLLVGLVGPRFGRTNREARRILSCNGSGRRLTG